MTTDALPGGPKNPLLARFTAFQNAIPGTLPRLRDFIVHAVGQVRIYKKIYPGIMHGLIFWGVTIQVLGTVINLMQMQLFIPFVELPFPRGTAYLGFEFIMDLAGLAILLGVAMAAIRRFGLRPKTLETRWDDIFALVVLGLIPIFGFTLEATRLISTSPAWAEWSPIGSWVASLMKASGVTPGVAASIHNTLFWTHIIVVLVFVASIPFTKLRHLFFTPLNILMHPRRKEGTLETIANIEEAEILGVGKITEFTHQQLLSFDACVRCGRCEESCPASISGIAYSPRAFIQSLRGAMVSALESPNGKGGYELLGDTIPEELPWYCTTCGACLKGCPSFINPVDEIIDLRRYQTLTTGKIPKSVGDALRNLERYGNPWGLPAEDRMAWVEGLEVREIMPGEETDVLLFLGCALAFDERNKKVARAFVSVLNKAKVDFAVLGFDEMCCGETARRLGNEYMFQEFAKQNIETLSKVKFNRIVSQCPHCYNTLKNEYPSFGGRYIVQHYTEYLAGLSLPLTDIPPNGNGLKGRLTFHDSCYLGRYNQIYSEPRRLLEQANVDRVEMDQHKENSFCCGGGGGQMWLETDPNTRINHRRLQNALDVKADIVATACPYCLLMFDDALRTKGLSDQIQVLDVAEVLARQLTS